MSFVVNSFIHNDQVYHQVLFADEDDRVELQNTDEQPLVIFTANCYIKIKDKIIGYISSYDQDNVTKLCYTLNDYPGQIHKTHIKMMESDAYFKVEEIISKHLLDQKLI